jgi:hypothetical protein
VWRFSVSLERGVLGIVSLALFRAIPVLCYLAASPRVRWRSRLALALTFGCVTALAIRVDSTLAGFLAGIAVAFAYLIAVALLLFWLAPRLSLRALRLGAVLVLAALLFVLLPAFLGRGWLPLGGIVVGWETMLSAHSYFVDTTTMGHPRCWREYLFFLFVNPTVVFRESGSRVSDPRLDLVGILRIALGMLAMLGHDVILLLMLQVPMLQADHHPGAWADYTSFLRTQALLGIALYCAHSGLASLQIGYMRCIGYRVPERYRYPILATSPQDFWQRWNTWVGRWGYRYVFLPVGRSLARSWRGRSGAIAAMIATFVVIGVLHDLGIYALRGVPPHGLPVPRMTFVFAAAAWSFAAFTVVERVLKRLCGRLAPALAWLVWIHLGLGLAWLAIPVLRDNRLPPPFESAFHSALVADRSR